MKTPSGVPWKRSQLLVLGTLVGVGALTTTAAVTYQTDVDVVFSPRADRSAVRASAESHLAVAGSSDASWVPAAQDWVGGQGSGAFVFTDQVLMPGTTTHLRVAVKNTYNRDDVDSYSITLSDPNKETSPWLAVDGSGRFTNLFPQVTYTVKKADVTILEASPITGGVLSAPVGSRLAEGQHEVFDIYLHLPAETGNEWQGATSALAIRFDALY